MNPSRAAVLAAMLAALPWAAAQADAERLEADLRARFAAAPGELTIGELSDGLLGGDATAENLSFVEDDGSRVRVARYVVEGDYDAPDAVVMEGVRLEGGGREAGMFSVERLRLEKPSGPLPWPEGRWNGADLDAEALTAEGLRLELESAPVTSADGKKVLGGQASPHGWLTIERLQASELSPQAIGHLEANGIAGHGEGLDEMGVADLTLASLELDGMRRLADDGEGPSLDGLRLEALSIESDRLVADLESLSVDGNLRDGEGGARFEALDLDLTRMIERAPAAQRTQLRLASNVLTGGSGQLRLDGEFDGGWEALGRKSLLTGEGMVTADDAFRWRFDTELPVRLPEGVDPQAYLSTMTDPSDMTLLGGRIETTLSELGLFARLPAVMAASRGIGEAEALEQARTQAKGFGTMLGPRVGRLLNGLVDMMEGQASELTVRLTLPAASDARTLTADPLGLPSKLSMEVETR
ncbi:hypothetical protein [Halomonas borealis]|uniref:hypothetical protein n=1 Tax=Halomonas borealis TaxID=2508710 RepID=UPI00109FBFAA|nr:hypothetical protein [Halomonas borealis]